MRDMYCEDFDEVYLDLMEEEEIVITDSDKEIIRRLVAKYGKEVLIDFLNKL